MSKVSLTKSMRSSIRRVPSGSQPFDVLEKLRHEFGPDADPKHNAGKTFVTFCAGSAGFYAAGLRLCQQVQKGGLFSKIVCYTDRDLVADREFWDKHGGFISANKRGFGYWLWKPHVILRELHNCSCLLYLDSGCEYNFRNQSSLIGAFQTLENSPLLSARGHGWKMAAWTKRDVLVHFEADTPEIHDYEYCQAGAILMLKCDQVIRCMTEWLDHCCNYHLIDDSPSNIPNHKTFIEHRHDQSLYNLCLLKYGLSGKDLPNSNMLKNRGHAIMILCNRSGTSKI